MVIYTKTGDKGKTSLFSLEKVEKDDIRVEAYGTVDELNSLIGLAKHNIESTFADWLIKIQRQLFIVGGTLASKSKEYPEKLTAKDVEELEEKIDRIVKREDFLGFDNFLLPGSTLESARLHVARTVCRRAERLMVTMMRVEPFDPIVLKYVNRLSDLLFAIAHYYEKAPIYYLVDKK